MTFNKLRYKILTNHHLLTNAQVENAMLHLKRRVARGEVKIDPCARCDNTSYQVDDDEIRCDHCGLVYEEDLEDEP